MAQHQPTYTTDASARQAALTCHTQVPKLFAMQCVGLGRLGIFLTCAACSLNPGAHAPDASGSAGESALDPDRDADGLCDVTELALGTDPDRNDTDGDGFLDAHEQIAGTDPRNRRAPSADHVVFLRAGERRDFSIGLTVDQSGAGVRGEFTDRNALDPAARRAGDFYRGSSASSAQPPENVRSIEASRARFASVLGRTRLQFELHFAAAPEAASDCAAVLPFDYVATLDDGTRLAKERGLLIVSQDAAPPEATDYCLPVACL